MDAEHQHELERNDLADWIEKGVAYMRPRWKYVFAAIGAVIVGYIGLVWYSASAATARATAWNDFFSGNYKDVADKYPSSDAARYAKLRLGDTAFQDGMTALLGSRDEALKSFDKAVQEYDAILADSSAPADVRRKATFNRAVAFECRGAPDKATEAYKTVSTQFPNTTEAAIAEERIKRLGRKSSVEFYRQFVDYKPSATDIAPPAPPPGSGAIPAMPDLFEQLKKIDAEKKGVKTPPPPPTPPADMKLPPPKTAPEPKKPVVPDAKPAETKAPAKDAKPADPKTPAKDAKPAETKAAPDPKAPPKEAKK